MEGKTILTAEEYLLSKFPNAATGIVAPIMIEFCKLHHEEQRMAYDALMDAHKSRCSYPSTQDIQDCYPLECIR